MRRRLALLISFGFSMISVNAHHGEHHEAPVVPSAASVPAPPPPPPPTPPVQQVQQVQVQVQTPAFLQTIVPTDIAGLAGSLGNSRGIKEQLHLPKSKSDKAATLIARDSRFQFSGEWIPFVTNSLPLGKSAEKLEHTTTRHEGKVEHWAIADKSKMPVFMPTDEANYEKRVNELVLNSGGILIRSYLEPARVSLSIDGKKLSIVVTAGLALVSTLDNKPVILNLTDRCCGAVAAWLPTKNGDQQKVQLGVGELVEIHKKDDKPFTTYLSSKVLTNQELSERHNVQVGRCHYLSVIRRYNLDRALKKSDLDKVLKTAAAMAYINPGSH